ncbi:MAG: hypothetical protein JNL90_03185 [Planctomycetes bacterium]|nr:hypothetical protein [Planctomycetota bacterium]
MSHPLARLARRSIPFATGRSALAALLLATAASHAIAQERSKPGPLPPPSGASGQAQPTAVKGGLAATSLLLEVGGVPMAVRRCESIGQRLAFTTSRTGASRERAVAAAECEPLELQLPFALDAALSKWIAEALAGAPRRQDVALLELDRFGATEGGYASRLREVGVDALLIPKLDASSKEAFEWGVRLGGATSLRFEPLGGKAPAALGNKQKAQLVANFRVRIDNVSCEYVTTIGPIEASCPLPPTGEKDGGSRATGAVSIAPIEVRFADRDAADWIRWFDDAAAKGSGAARAVTIELLDATMKEVTATLTLSGALPNLLRRDFGEGGRPGFTAELTASALAITFPKG